MISHKWLQKNLMTQLPISLALIDCWYQYQTVKLTVDKNYIRNTGSDIKHLSWSSSRLQYFVNSELGWYYYHYISTLCYTQVDVYKTLPLKCTPVCNCFSKTVLANSISLFKYIAINGPLTKLCKHLWLLDLMQRWRYKNDPFIIFGTDSANKMCLNV